MTRIASVLVMVSFSATLIGCGNDEPPTLPPEESMLLPSFTAGSTTAQSTGNVITATLAVSVVTLAIELALVTPRIIFAGTLTADPVRDGDDWVWQQDFGILGFDTELRGSFDGVLNTQLIFNGNVNPNLTVEDFTWFTGRHESNNGTWAFRDPVSDTAAIDINWRYESDEDRSVEFVNTSIGTDEFDDSVTYTQNGNQATMAIHDEMDNSGNSSDFSVEWNVSDGSGKLTLQNGSTLCWDTLANGQGDIACP